MNSINFFSEGIEFSLINHKPIKSWLIGVVQSEKQSLEELNYIFCNDEYLLKVNQEFLSHNYYTDIITFDNSEGDDMIGDIFLSIDRVKENAETYHVPFEHELHRVMVHGLLHLCGYADKEESDKAIMRGKEDTYLSLLND